MNKPTSAKQQKRIELLQRVGGTAARKELRELGVYTKPTTEIVVTSIAYDRQLVEQNKPTSDSPMNKTTDNTLHPAILSEDEWEVNMSIAGKLTLRQTREVLLAIKQQRDAAVSALRDIVAVFNVKDIDPLQAFVAIEQGRAAIAAAEGSQS